MNRRTGPPSVADQHRAWLELLDTDGPFLAVPALKRGWPTGMPPPDKRELATLKDAKPAFEKAWDNWDTNRDDPSAIDLYREARDAWVDAILRDVIGWKGSYLPGAAGVEVRSPADYTVVVRPDGALVRGDLTGALVLVTDPVDSLRDPGSDGWAASPIDRMEELLRASGARVGVVTDGRWWAVVSARPQTMVASGIVDAHRWIEFPAVRNAFIELLRRRRLIGGRPEDRLTELFGASVAAAAEITEALGTQVRRAVELLVQAMSEVAVAARDQGAPDPLPAKRSEVYEAAVTVMMRVVFLLFAEERSLLPQSRLFAMGYGISDEFDTLDARAREDGSETLDATHLTWHRLLATSQALHRGASFEGMDLQSYGGSLFDPDRFPFVTAIDEHGLLAVTVSDRVMLEILRAVQFARLPGEPARRISFRDIDVEQIGYIYEGLLGYSCKDVKEITVGLIGKPGEEPEIPLATLEGLRAAKQTDAAFAAAIESWVKEDQSAATLPSKATLAKAIRAEPEDTDRALRAVTSNVALRDRLRPFIGIIRRDLRDRPTVMLPGGVLMVETPSRASAGAHYTPKDLAEDVVRYALEPLVYDPGPHQRADNWEPVDSGRILSLKIADIACGSGAFLVAAANYLAKRLVEAWQRDGVIGDMTPREQKVHAIRTVIAKCLYGADINAMAVEMCKLSLWLVSLDPNLPFSFVDDKIQHGNSLIGLTDERQFKMLHIDPEVKNQQRSLSNLDVDGVLRRAKDIRRELASEVDDHDPLRSSTAKRRQWDRYQKITADLEKVADTIVAAGLRHGGKPGKALKDAYKNLDIALASTSESDRQALDEIIATGLTPTVATDYALWKPLHWILVVPDVMERGGFDAIIGNPPFLGGQKLTGAMGTNTRDWFVNTLAGGQKGSADLVAYFFLRAFSLLTPDGNLGLIATNTVWQGDTRQVGLKQIVRDGFTITRCIQSRSWPVASANLEYAAAWGTRGCVARNVPRIADDMPVEHICTLLEPGPDIDPVRLTENTRIAFIGCYVLGMGFILEDPEEATAWIDADPKNAEVLFPYLSGEDLNSRPDTSAPRRVIDFGVRSEIDAKEYGLPYRRVVDLVKPERMKNRRRPRRERWWQFAELAQGMRQAIAGLDEVLVIALVSKTVMPMRVPTGQVFSHKIGVFATNSFADQAALSSSMHYMWTIKYSSTMRTDVNYSPSDVFLTFPRPEPTGQLAEIGRTLDTERREIMLRRDLGLTKLYNMVNDPDVGDAADADVARMRQIHTELDHAVMDAYRWGSLELNHGFHTYRQMTRWTVSPAARVAILDRLLEENLRRAAAQGDVPPPAAESDEEDDG
jgi:hypothetical protein